jgi:hypothetical protein
MKEALSYASFLSVNLTSSSSIPNEFSSVFIPVNPNSKELLLRGTDPTIVYYSLTPSVIFMKIFTSQSSEWPSSETGYHIAPDQNPMIGSLSTQET